MFRSQIALSSLLPPLTRKATLWIFMDNLMDSRRCKALYPCHRYISPILGIGLRCNIETHSASLLRAAYLLPALPFHRSIVLPFERYTGIWAGAVRPFRFYRSNGTSQ